MWPRWVVVVMAVGLLACAIRPGWAGAWNSPEGHGLVIVQGIYDTGNWSFDRRGRPVKTASYHKSEGWAYVTYGVTDWLQVILQPDVVRTTVSGTPGGRYTGLGTSSAGAQVQLPSVGPAVFALQGTFRLPASQAENNVALVGNTSRDTDVRGLAGLPIAIGPWPGFLNGEAGYRFRGARTPDAIHVDLTGGVRPRPDTLLLLQGFTQLATQPGSATDPRSSYANLQGSVVYDLDPHWSVQLGVFGTVWGRNALRERGLQTGVWYRF